MATGADAQGGNLFIVGINFGIRSPRVLFGGHELQVLSHSPTEIVATLPTALLPATYELRLIFNEGQHDDEGHGTSFDVTIGAAGAAGPAGPIGPTGPQGSLGLKGT